MVHERASSGKRSLCDLLARASLQADAPILEALCHELGMRFIVGPRLSPDEEFDLALFLHRPLRPLLPPGQTLPLSRAQARLVSLLESAGEDGVDELELRYLLFPRHRDPANSLRQLVHQTNLKLRKFDPHRRRIKRLKKKKLILKKLSNT